MSYFRLLQERVPLALWLGQVASSIGDRLYSMAILWLALSLTGSPISMAATAIAESVCLTAVGLFAGAWIDRVDRLKFACMIDVVRALVVLVVPMLHSVGALHLSALVATGSVMGILDGLFDPALNSALPTLVASDGFAGFAGLMDTPSRLARLLGSGSAGILLTVISVFGFFALDSVSFGISALSLALVTAWRATAPRSTSPTKKVHARTLLHDVLSGLRMVSGSSKTTVLIIMDAIGNFTFVAYNLAGLVLVTRDLHFGLGGFGWLIGTYGVGSLLGNLGSGNLSLARIRYLLATTGWIGIGVGFMLMGTASSIGFVLVGSTLAGICGSIAHVSRAAFLASEFPHASLGKVYSIQTITSTLGSTVGTAVCGYALTVWSARMVIGGAGAIVVVSDMVMVAAIVMRTRKKRVIYT